MELDEPAASEVLRDFVRVLDGGMTKYDSAIDAHDDMPHLKVESDY